MDGVQLGFDTGSDAPPTPMTGSPGPEVEMEMSQPEETQVDQTPVAPNDAANAPSAAFKLPHRPRS